MSDAKNDAAFLGRLGREHWEECEAKVAAMMVERDEALAMLEVARDERLAAENTYLKERGLLALAEAVRPFVGLAITLEPGDDDGKPWHSSMSIRENEPEEGLLLREGLPDDLPLIAAGAGWRGVPASLVTGITLGDFRHLRAAYDAARPPE